MSSSSNPQQPTSTFNQLSFWTFPLNLNSHANSSPHSKGFHDELLPTSPPFHYSFNPFKRFTRKWKHILEFLFHFQLVNQCFSLRPNIIRHFFHVDGAPGGGKGSEGGEEFHFRSRFFMFHLRRLDSAESLAVYLCITLGITWNRGWKFACLKVIKFRCHISEVAIDFLISIAWEPPTTTNTGGYDTRLAESR